MITIQLKDAARYFKDFPERQARKAVEVIQVAVKLNAPRRIQETINRTKPQPVDRGGYRRSFKVLDVKDGATVYSDHPAAAVIEGGRRPGARMPPVEPLVGWVKRKGLVKGTHRPRIGPQRPGNKSPKIGPVRRGDWTPEKEAWKIAFLIARKLKTRGMQGRWILKRASVDIWIDVRRALDEAFGK